MPRNTLRNLPEVLQTGTTRSKISYEFDSSIDVYRITKGPATRVFEVRSGSTTFTENTDYDLIEDSNGDFVKIDWGIGGDSPNDGDLFTIDQEYESILSRYISAHDEEMQTITDDLVDIISIRQVDNATGDELDRIGALFGQLGRRQGRSDSDYRAYLKSVLASFEGRGSRSGLKFAVAAAVDGDEEDVTIVEDVENLSYTITIENLQGGVISGVINDLAELADPSGVELENAVIITEGEQVELSGSSSTTVSSDTGLGSGILSLDGTSSLN